MTIKEIWNKYRNSLPNRTLLIDLELFVRVKYIPDKSSQGELMVLADDTGTLEAVANTQQIFDFLRIQSKNKTTIKVKGYLRKHEYDDLAFTIEKVIEPISIS